TLPAAREAIPVARETIPVAREAIPGPWVALPDVPEPLPASVRERPVDHLVEELRRQHALPLLEHAPVTTDEVAGRKHRHRREGQAFSPEAIGTDQDRVGQVVVLPERLEHLGAFAVEADADHLEPVLTAALLELLEARDVAEAEEAPGG